MNTQTSPITESGILVWSDTFAQLHFLPDVRKAMISTRSSYLPIDVFQTLLHQLEGLLALHEINGLVFDKRSLKIFHQPSMLWYYTQWKPAMLEKYGLSNHFKLLPKEAVFRQHVAIAKEEIFARHESALALQRLDIRYFETLEEALMA